MDTTQATKIEKRHIKVNEINYRNNLEKIVNLEKSFDYASNKADYWGKPEQSILYGTPLYEAASESQKLALNHLYWVAHYDHIAAAEASTIHYNQVTAGVFSQIGSSYEALCSNLKHEAKQEKCHIHGFHNIFSKTKIALLGKRTMGLKLKKNYSRHQNWIQKLVSEFQQSFSKKFQDDAWRFLSKTLLKSKNYHYSSYLQEFDKKGGSLTALTKGFVGVAIPRPLLQFFTFCWGSSPFLACQYYTYRYAANPVLKKSEHN